MQLSIGSNVVLKSTFHCTLYDSYIYKLDTPSSQDSVEHEVIEVQKKSALITFPYVLVHSSVIW